MRSSDPEPFWPASIEARVERVFAEQSALVRTGASPVVQFVLGTAPWAGGAAAVLSENARKRERLRMQEFLVDFAQEMTSRDAVLSRRMDVSILNDDRWVARVAHVLQIVRTSDDSHKLEFLREYLISGLLRGQPSLSWQTIFDTYVSRLTGTHLTVLAACYKRQKDLPEVERFGRVEVAGKLPMLAGLVQTVTGLETRLINLVLTDLESNGLLVDWFDLGNQIKPRVGYSLSTSGYELMQYLAQEW